MNQQILTQNEVDALLQGITGESQAPEQEDTASEGGARTYDLASQERIVRSRMPTMEMVNDRFARNIRAGLFNLIRKSPEVSIGGIKVQKYGAFLREIVVPTNFNIVSVKPLRGSALIVCDPNLVFAVIDALFGGTGKHHTRIEGREFSPTEQRVILRLMQTIMAEYRKSWVGVYPLELEYQRSEMQPQFANVASPSEMVVTTSFALEIGDTSGSINMCFPYSTLSSYWRPVGSSHGSPLGISFGSGMNSVRRIHTSTCPSNFTAVPSKMLPTSNVPCLLLVEIDTGRNPPRTSLLARAQSCRALLLSAFALL